MALSKTARRWIIIAAIPIGLIVIALIAAKIYFTSDRLKALILPKIEDATHRKVEMRDISLSVFPSIGVDIDQLKVFNVSGTKFTHEELLALDRLTVDVSLFRLIGGTVDISKISIEHPVFYLEISPEGKKNFTSGAPARIEKKESERPAGGGAFLLANLVINDGEIEYLDRKYDSRMKIGGLTQHLRIDQPAGGPSLHVTGSSRIDSLSYGSLAGWYIANQPLSADEELTYNPAADQLTFDKVGVNIRELPLTVTGNISKVTEPVMMMDLTVAAANAGMKEVLSLIPPEMLKKAEGISSSGTFAFTLTMKGPSGDLINPATVASFSISNGTIRYGSLPQAITNVELHGSFEKPSAPVGEKGIGVFTLDKFAAQFGADAISGHATVSRFGDPLVNATVNGQMNLGEVHQYYPLEKGTELGGLLHMNVNLDGAVSAPTAMKSSGSLEFKNVSVNTATSAAPLKNLNGTVNFNNQVIESKQLAVNVGQSDLAMSFSLKNYLPLVLGPAAKAAGKPTATVTLTSNQLNMADLMPEEPAPATAGGPGKPAGASASLLPPVDVNATVNVAKLVTKKFTFTNAHGDATVSNGVINLNNMSVDAFNGKIQTKGMLDLRNPDKKPFDLDLNIAGVESNAMLSNFTSFGKYLFGKFSTTTKLKGDLNDTLGLNTQTLLGNGNVQMSEGKLSGLPLTSKLSEVTSLTELKDINFKNWTNAFSIENGRMQVKDLRINSGSTDFLVGGSQGLDGSMEYNLNVKLPPSVSDRIKLGGTADQLLQYFKDKDGRLSLTFDVSGTSSAPVVKLSTRAAEDAAKNALDQKAQEAKKKLEDDLKKKAGEGLMKIFKKP